MQRDLFSWRFDGRLRRWPFWIAWFATSSLFGLFDSVPERFAWVALLCEAPLWYLVLTLVARRLHDLDRSGWWQLVIWLPLSASLAGVYLSALWAPSTATTFAEGIVWTSIITAGGVIVVGLWPGSPGDNRFGPPPARYSWRGTRLAEPPASPPAPDGPVMDPRFPPGSIDWRRPS